KNWQEHRIPDEIAADGNAKQIVIALFDVRTDAGEIDIGRVDLSEKIGSAKDRLFGDVGAELQHQERGKVIGGILDVAPDRDPKHVDRRARYVTQHELHERSDEGDLPVRERSANRLDALVWRLCGRSYFLDEGDVFVANRHRRPSFVWQGQLSAALRRQHGKVTGQAQWCQKRLQPFENLSLSQSIE